MSYQYQPSAKEQKAADRLREKGWKVIEPACPECGGLGSISETHVDGINRYSMTTKPCPNGCTVSYFFTSTGTYRTVVSNNTSTEGVTQ